MFKIVMIILGILYFISPIDLIPDVIPILGKVDDLLVILWIYWNYFRKGSNGAQQSRETSGTYQNSWNAHDAHEAHRDHGTRGHSTRKTQDPYDILEVSPGAGLDEIKQAYRRQANRYHPDKVAHLGQELQELAKEKFQEIQWAYEELMKRKGSTTH